MKENKVYVIEDSLVDLLSSEYGDSIDEITMMRFKRRCRAIENVFQDWSFDYEVMISEGDNIIIEIVCDEISMRDFSFIVPLFEDAKAVKVTAGESNENGTDGDSYPYVRLSFEYDGIKA